MTVDSLLTSNPRIALCEPFFREDDTKKDLSTKDDHQWCLEPPHLDNFITAAHTMLHEVTHLAFIVLHAVEAVVGEISKEAREEMESVTDFPYFLSLTYFSSSVVPMTSTALQMRRTGAGKHTSTPTSMLLLGL